MSASSSKSTRFLSFILESLVNKADSLNDIGHRNLVGPLPLDGDPLRDDPRLILNEVERLYHKVDSDLPVHPDREHSDHPALQAVTEHERGATAFLHIERDALETAHVEEGLVLYRCEAGVMEEPAVHEVTLLEEVVLVLLCGRVLPRELAVIEIVRVLHHLYRVVAGLGVQSTLHQDVEEETHRRVV